MICPIARAIFRSSSRRRSSSCLWRYSIGKSFDHDDCYLWASYGGKLVDDTSDEGDEFATAVLVRDADVAAKAAKETHAKLSAILRNCGYPVNCSIGALVIAADDQRSAEQLIAGADRLTYLAKQRGKGRLEISDRVSLEEDARRGECHPNWQIAGKSLLS
jgi:hypothetical protein